MDNLTSFALLRKLAQRLKYSQVIDILEREVIVRSPDSAQADVLEQLADGLPAELEPGGKDPVWIGATIAKYGLMDLEYGLPSEMGSGAARIGANDLRQMLKGNDPVEPFESVLELLLEDLDKTPTTLRLYLTTEHQWRADKQKYVHEGLPNSYWPLTFVVQDARITNSSLMWANHHFYL